jgi:hypothetical protein
MKKAILLSFVVILGTAMALQAEFQVNTYTTDDQEFPAIAMGAQGDFVVVWRSAKQDAGSRGTYGQRFDADGTPIGGEFKINTTSVGGRVSTGPSVALDSYGNFVVAWTGYRDDEENIIARRYNAGGSPITGEFVVNTQTHSAYINSHIGPTVAMNASGAFVIVWQAWHGDSSGHGNWCVYGRTYNSNGVPQADEFMITQLPHGYVPDVAMDESGDFVVAWKRNGDSVNPPMGSYIRFRRYNADGTPKDDAVQITDELNIGIHSGPSMAMDGDGDFVIAWPVGPWPYDIYAQRFDANGAPIDEPFLVNTHTDDSQGLPSVGMDEQGEFVIVWFSMNQDGSDMGIFGQRYNSDGTPVDEEFQVNTYTSGRQWHPDIALSESGRFVTVWQDEDGQDGSGYGIFAEFGRLPRQLTYYVDADATGANNGSSWDDAYNDLQDALAVVLTGDEIHVAQGLYKPAGYIPPPPPPPPLLADSTDQYPAATAVDRTATFRLKNGVVIKGGYAGAGEPDPNARDIDANKTILSGDLAGNDEPNFVNYEENSYHVVTGSNCDSTAILDGFTITAGNASNYPTFSVGGGMHNTQSSPTVTNCTFTQNTAHYAGAMSNQDGSSPIVTDCTFTDNYAPGGGGGAIFYWHSGGSLTNCSFRNNSGRHGGAARIYASNVTITNCLFADNYSSGGEGGGGVYLGHCTAFFMLCTLSRNAADGSGGGIFNRDDSSNFTLQNCVLWNNSDSGGMDESAQVHSVTTMATIDYCCIQGWTGNFGGTGNIDADPCFVEPGYWDPNEVWVDGDYHLLPCSPCINTGDPDYIAEPNETDLDGRPRVIGGRIDMGAYEFNHVPLADAGPDRTVEAQAPWGATVTLDGSASSDADSTPGTIDDINDFIWYEIDPCDPNADVFLGSGRIVDCNLPLGEHIISLEVVDRAGDFDIDDVNIIVQDTTPPDFNLSVTPTILWPPNHEMVEITTSWTVSDECDPDPNVSLVSVVASEGDDTIGDGHTTDDIQIGDDGTIYLRAERSGPGIGRIYTITYQAVDDCGNVTVRSAAVGIPHELKFLARIGYRWLWRNRTGNLPEDLNGDGIVNLEDFAIFALFWIQ